MNHLKLYIPSFKSTCKSAVNPKEMGRFVKSQCLNQKLSEKGIISFNFPLIHGHPDPFQNHFLTKDWSSVTNEIMKQVPSSKNQKLEFNIATNNPFSFSFFKNLHPKPSIYYSLFQLASIPKIKNDMKKLSNYPKGKVFVYGSIDENDGKWQCVLKSNFQFKMNFLYNYNRCHTMEDMLGMSEMLQKRNKKCVMFTQVSQEQDIQNFRDFF